MSEREHKMTAHPEVMAVQRANRRLYLIRYFPVMSVAIVFAGVSVLLHQWWARFGLLAGIYAMFGILLLFGVRAWRREKPVRLGVDARCLVCSARMAGRDLEQHISTAHPDVASASKRSGWLMTPALLCLLVYMLGLMGLWVLDLLPGIGPPIFVLLIFGPAYGWAAIVAVVGVVLGRRYLKQA